jgi:hypothetical protein
MIAQKNDEAMKQLREMPIQMYTLELSTLSLNQKSGEKVSSK